MADTYVSGTQVQVRGYESVPAYIHRAMGRDEVLRLKDGARSVRRGVADSDLPAVSGWLQMVDALPVSDEASYFVHMKGVGKLMIPHRHLILDDDRPRRIMPIPESVYDV